MSAPIKAITKSLVLSIPYTREKYLQREFLRSAPCCRGIFKTFTEAMSSLPEGKVKGYNHRGIPEHFISSIDELNPCDYPVLFWLERLLPKIGFVFELGGSMGKGYYSYRRYLTFPKGLRWVICELPETVSVGRDVARERNDPCLEFTTERQTEGDPDLYVTFGALQYIEEPFAEIIAKLRVKPAHILVNRVPMTNGTPFITLQNNGGWFVPYKVDKVSQFVENVEALGYELMDKFEMTRPVSFLMGPEYQASGYYGMYFRLK